MVHSHHGLGRGGLLIPAVSVGLPDQGTKCIYVCSAFRPVQTKRNSSDEAAHRTHRISLVFSTSNRVPSCQMHAPYFAHFCLVDATSNTSQLQIVFPWIAGIHMPHALLYNQPQYIGQIRSDRCKYICEYNVVLVTERFSTSWQFGPSSQAGILDSYVGCNTYGYLFNGPSYKADMQLLLSRFVYTPHVPRRFRNFSLGILPLTYSLLPVLIVASKSLDSCKLTGKSLNHLIARRPQALLPQAVDKAYTTLVRDISSLVVYLRITMIIHRTITVSQKQNN